MEMQQRNYKSRHIPLAHNFSMISFSLAQQSTMFLISLVFVITI